METWKRFKHFLNMSGIGAAFGQHLRELEEAFETTATDIEYAMQNEDAVQSKLSNNIKLSNFRIRGFSSTGTGDEAVYEYAMRLGDAVDLALEILVQESRLGFEPDWISVRFGLELIQTFLTFVPKWSDSNEVVRDHLGDLVSSIEDAFKNAGPDVFDAFRKGYAEILNEVRYKLLKKIEILKPRILIAYSSLSEYAFQTSATDLPVLDSVVWTSLCGRLATNAWNFYGMIGSDDSRYSMLHGIVNLVKDLVNIYFITGSNHSELRKLAFRLEGIVIGIASLLFQWWVEQTGEDEQNMMLPDLSQRIKVTYFEILDCYLTAINSSEFESVSKLFIDGLKMDLVTSRGQFQTLLDVEDRIRWLPYVIKQKIVKIDCSASSMEYSSMAFDMRFQLSQQSVLLRLEIVLRDLGEKAESASNGTFKSILQGLSSMQAFVMCPGCKRSNSGKLFLIFKGIYQVIMDAELVHKLYEEGDSGSEISWFNDERKHKVNLDFKLLKIQAFLLDQTRFNPSLTVSVKEKIHTLDEGLDLLLASDGLEDLRLILSQMPLLLSNFRERINLQTSDMKGLYLKVQRILSELNLPKTHIGLAIVDSLSKKLHECLDCKPDSMGHSLKGVMEAVIEELDSLRSFLEEVGESKKEADSNVN